MSREDKPFNIVKAAMTGKAGDISKATQAIPDYFSEIEKTSLIHAGNQLAERGLHEDLLFLRKQGMPVSGHMIDTLVEHEEFHVLMKLCMEPPIDSNATESALITLAGLGREKELALLCKNTTNPKSIDIALLKAIRHGHDRCVAEMMPYCDIHASGDYAVIYAAQEGQIRCLSVLTDGQAYDDDIVLKSLIGAGNGGHKKCLHHLFETFGNERTRKILFQDGNLTDVPGAATIHGEFLKRSQDDGTKLRKRMENP